MINLFIEALRTKALSLANLPTTIRVPGHGGKPTLEDLRTDDATVDDLAFALQGLEQQFSKLLDQSTALRRLHDMARARGAIGTDTVIEIFGGEI